MLPIFVAPTPLEHWCPANAGCITLRDGLFQLQQSAGLIVELRLVDGIYNESTSGGAISSELLAFGLETTASQITILGDGAAVLQHPSSATWPMLQVTQNAPAVRVSGIQFHGSHHAPAIILRGSSLELDGCTLYNNSAGGVVVESGGSIAITNSRFSSNGAYDVNATGHVNGGALKIVGGSDATIDNCTFFNNTALDGGAIYTVDTAGLSSKQNPLRVTRTLFDQNTH